MSENAGEETQKVDDELVKSGDKHPETVPWNQYVGIKESLGKKLDTEKTKVGTLEEQLKGTISTDELSKIKTELADKTTEHQKVVDELKGVKDKSTSEKREALVKGGVPEEKVKEMSEEALNGAIGVLTDIKVKPKADLGGGGGGAGELKGSPMELARNAYSSSNK